MTCSHENFSANVEVNRITDHDEGEMKGLFVDIQVNCSDCGVPVIFHCQTFGMLPDRPAISPNGQQLRVPGRTADKPEDFGLQLPGYSMSADVPQGRN